MTSMPTFPCYHCLHLMHFEYIRRCVSFLLTRTFKLLKMAAKMVLDRVRSRWVCFLLFCYVPTVSMVNALGWSEGRGEGNPRELDFVKRRWVGIMTSTMVPRVGNLTRPPYWMNFLKVPFISFNVLCIRSVVPKARNLTQNGDPRVGKLTLKT